MAKAKAKSASKPKAKPKAKPKTGPRAKPAAKKAARPKAKAAAKPRAKAKLAPRVESKPKALELFKAYAASQLPSEGGYIVSSFLDETSAYSRYEVVAYNGVKAIYLTEDGLTFQTDGNKLFVLAEPPSYAQKHLEPFTRTAKDQVPHRFAEMEILTTRNQTKVMVSKSPVMTYGSFTILKPSGINFSFIFYNTPDVFDTISKFFASTLNKEAGVPQIEADKAARLVIEGLQRFTIWSK